MKRLLFALIVGGIGYVLWRMYTEEQRERDLWTEVTDDVA
jgi:hypothetical protein